MTAPLKRVAERGIVVRGNDIDTDQIIPARYMKVVSFEGLGEFAFRDQRFDEAENPKPHPFNDPDRAGAGILIVNRNFGCGSSREHAPQALMRWGIKAVIGESFAEIFAGNCTAMGIPAISMSHTAILDLQQRVDSDANLLVEIDLPHQRVKAGEFEADFTMPAAYRSALIAGSWDSTSVLLERVQAIRSTVASLPYLNDFAVQEA